MNFFKFVSVFFFFSRLKLSLLNRAEQLANTTKSIYTQQCKVDYIHIYFKYLPLITISTHTQPHTLQFLDRIFYMFSLVARAYIMCGEVFCTRLCNTNNIIFDHKVFLFVKKLTSYYNNKALCFRNDSQSVDKKPNILHIFSEVFNQASRYIYLYSFTLAYRFFVVVIVEFHAFFNS